MSGGISGVTRVIVGVDGSEGSLAALRQGAEEASRHRAALYPVLAWTPPGGEAADALQPAPLDVRWHWQRQAETSLEKACEAVLGAAPFAMPVMPKALRAEAGPALVACARHDADLLVIGAGRRGPLHHLVHGSVVRHCCRHAHCPLLVVPFEGTG
ncbi:MULTISPECIES: universal stress protein [Streptomyces]|uniref:UspA domain-containing protein n=2 Tax=Streptomyces TaxID=1883 RepID=A0A2N8PHI7_STRNR|nr:MULTISPECIES: universal stress protein [Streptomyces]PNE40503.1 hypothetical protein AOB60_06165 [Streptomyces noursei]SHM92600.1 Nucleotide-binding universal stress protein, UspA family [Streptomyces yunnanensis]